MAKSKKEKELGNCSTVAMLQDAYVYIKAEEMKIDCDI